MRIVRVTRYDKDMVNVEIIKGDKLQTHLVLAKNGDYYCSGVIPIKADEEGNVVFDKNGNDVLEDGLWEMARFIWSHITE